MAGDDELIAACVRNDADAWAELHRRHHRRLASIARGYGLGPHDAEEVVQITFTIFLRSASSLREDSNLSAWLATVARRHTWRLLEKRRREREAADELGASTPAHTESDDRHVQLDWVRRGLTEMSPRCRELIEALFFRTDEPSYQQISEELDMPIGSIGPNRSRCLAKLREILEASSRVSGAEL